MAEKPNVGVAVFVAVYQAYSNKYFTYREAVPCWNGWTVGLLHLLYVLRSFVEPQSALKSGAAVKITLTNVSRTQNRINLLHITQQVLYFVDYIIICFFEHL